MADYPKMSIVTEVSPSIGAANAERLAGASFNVIINLSGNL